MRLILMVLALAITACGNQADPGPATNAAKPAQAADGAGMSRSHGGIIDITWRWVRTVTPVEIIEVNEPDRYTLHLGMDGRAAMRFDCNRGGGEYEIGDGTIDFGVMMSTRAACPPDTLDHVFMKQLDEVTSFFVQDGQLFLEMPMDSGTMRFERADTATTE